MLETCPKCGKPRPVGTFHCEIPEWYATEKPRNKKVEQRARMAWNRAKRLNRIKPRTSMSELNQIYVNCPFGADIVHLVRLSEGWHEPSNLAYKEK